MKMNPKILRLFGMTFAVCVSLSAFGSSALEERARFYQARYQLTTPEQKRVNDRGNGDENLYGTRNFRQVLRGILYRGGANNYYHRTQPRDNRNPLPEDGLQNLCKEGFEKSIYLYTSNFSTATPRTDCTTRTDQKANVLNYTQITALTPTTHYALLREVFDNIRDPNAKPLYGHCWNGWHASGLFSALSLRQFCGWSAERAVQYWDQNTDGQNKAEAYERVREMIRAFQPLSELEITAQEQAIICP